MRKILYSLLSAIAVAALCSCEKDLAVEGAEEGNSALTIMTRSGNGDAKISYPVTVYAMNSSGTCVRKDVLTSSTSQFTWNLKPLTYQIYAVAGATEDDYELPGINDASATSAVTLKDGVLHADLMTASNSITLNDEESNTLTLSLQRKVMHLESIEMRDIPTTVDNVSVSFSPLYDDLLLNGSYSESTSTQTVNLTEQSDGTTWKNAEEWYMLPASGSATITVKLSKGGTVTSYSYSCPEPLAANYHIQITGTYVDNRELTLTGVITGATWEGTTVIEFTFDEDGSSTTGGGTTGGGGSGSGSEEGVEEGTAPAVNSLYKDCVVIYTTDDTTGDYTLVTVIHKNEQEMEAGDSSLEDLESDIEAALQLYDINDITGWRLPTKEEVKNIYIGYINDALGGSGTQMDPNALYYYRDGTELKTFKGASSGMVYTNGQRLRPVTTL